MRLDHLLSRVTEQDPTTDLCSMPFAVKGDGLQALPITSQLLRLRDPGLVAQLVRAQSL